MPPDAPAEVEKVKPPKEVPLVVEELLPAPDPLAELVVEVVVVVVAVAVMAEPAKLTVDVVVVEPAMVDISYWSLPFAEKLATPNCYTHSRQISVYFF